MLWRGIELVLIFVQERWITVYQNWADSPPRWPDLTFSAYVSLPFTPGKRAERMDSLWCRIYDQALTRLFTQQFFDFLSFRGGLMQPRLASNLLCPQTCSSSTDPCTSTSQVLRLHTCATMSVYVVLGVGPRAPRMLRKHPSSRLLLQAFAEHLSLQLAAFLAK